MFKALERPSRHNCGVVNACEVDPAALHASTSSGQRRKSRLIRQATHDDATKTRMHQRAPQQLKQHDGLTKNSKHDEPEEEIAQPKGCRSNVKGMKIGGNIALLPLFLL